MLVEHPDDFPVGKAALTHRRAGICFILAVSSFLGMMLTPPLCADQVAAPNAAPVIRLTKEPVVRWEPSMKISENPRTGGSCGETAESCSACPAGMDRGRYQGRTALGYKYMYFCCAAGSKAAVHHSSGVGSYGVCLSCCSDCLSLEPRTEQGRRDGFDCFTCNHRGYSWQLLRGQQVCLSCGEGYVYSERTGLCHLDSGPRPRVPR